jgi:hypothetical protein
MLPYCIPLVQPWNAECIVALLLHWELPFVPHVNHFVVHGVQFVLQISNGLSVAESQLIDLVGSLLQLSVQIVNFSLLALTQCCDFVVLPLQLEPQVAVPFLVDLVCSAVRFT